MFIEQYRLERNPFAADRVRSVFASHSYRLAASRMAQLVGGQLHGLYLSGPPGVGKSTLVRQELKAAENLSIGWVDTGEEDPMAVLQSLVHRIGPGSIEASVSELRRILEVYLLHQAARGRRSLIVALGVERDSEDVLREIEALSRLRLRGRPVAQLIITTRSEELIDSFLSRHDGSTLAPVLHQRVHGFSLEETAAYLRASVQGAGSDWFDELITTDLLVDIQAFTQGIVGDIDALCREALAGMAEVARHSSANPQLTLAILKGAAAKLHLKYDATAWKTRQHEVLAPGAVRQSRHNALTIEAARLVVTSGGRQVAEVSLDRPRMVLGRDNHCDISLDSNYVSRYQNLFMETADGWMLIDLNSTNGCFVNGRRVHEHRLRDGDLISLGQHQLRFSGTSSDFPSHDGTSTGLIFNSKLARN